MQYWRDEETAEAEEELSLAHEAISNAISKCKGLGIDVDQAHVSYIRTIGVCLNYPDIARLVCPELERDDEDLVSASSIRRELKISAFDPGYHFKDDFGVMMHPYFRRGYHPKSNYAPRFVEEFWMLQNADISSSIAIDDNRLKIYTDGSSYMERDTWYGAKFEKDIGQVDNGLVKMRPSPYLLPLDIDFYFHGNQSLDIKWSQKGSIKTFQAEEFKTEIATVLIGGEPYFPARYIHAEYDLERGCFRHFDGAIHLYDFDEYVQRLDSDFNYNAKSPKKIKADAVKVFRMDGAIPHHTWSDFCSHFLTGNPLMHEYFNGCNTPKIESLIQLRKAQSEGRAS